MNEQASSWHGPSKVVDRLVQALNAHDLEAMVACFAEDYRNETPAHPQRSFRGNEQVRRNWTQILHGVPDLHALVPRIAVDGDTVWTEWYIAGTRRDGADHRMRGVVIFGVTGDAITSARFYLEPVEETSGDADAVVGRLMGTGTADADQTGVQS
jgi:ketosteroid isomerase-like protein